MASKFFPLRVRRCCCKTGASRLISFSEGGGEPSTHPFHPFFTATLFLRGAAGNGADWLPDWEPITSSSAGVRGLLDEVRDVLDEIEGSGVEPGVKSWGGGEDVGEGVTDTDRWMAGIWIVGVARQNEEVAAGAVGIGWCKELVLAKFPSVDACWFESARSAALWRARVAAFEHFLFLSLPCYMSESCFFISSSFHSFTRTNSIQQIHRDISWRTDIEAVLENHWLVT